uniref:Reverse transcriptase domain-containing protein n=1 Tax=Tanacetum cinerariifolium TaxID=118510 RepID=A0A6L2NGL3_TANCI|nr:reverse transcriptase domain-containing protein [Tanacetum cinerariifolium]
MCDMFKYRDTENEAVRLMMFPLSTGEAKTWLNELSEGTIKTWNGLRTAFNSRFFPSALFDRILREIQAFSQHENESLTDAWLRTSNSDTNKIMARMDAMTLKMDAQYKELQSNAKKEKPDLDEDDIPMSREEVTKFMQTFSFSCSALADLGASINLMPYSLYAKLYIETLKPTKMSVRLADSINVIDEILEEDFDALLDEGSKILHSIERTYLEKEIFAEFDKFIAMTADENSESESNTEEPPFEKITINTDYKIKTSLEEPPTDLELKPLPDNLEYVFLEEPNFLPVIILSQLSTEKKNKLISLLEDKKPVVQKQKRLNPNMQEVFKKEIVKFLDIGIIYPIADSPWVSPIHRVPKKGGITVVTNKNDKLVSTRTVTCWRVCIDYRKLNKATAKDHFPLPFMDQMLERLAGNKYCFLDGFLGYFQIPIDPNDQEKTTFTCPFGTYTYRRMPFGLCNAPATFQRCMLAIFHDMIEELVEVFMDDFFVFGNSFEVCLNNLDKMLQCCKDAHLVLNWEKCHFMVKEGIMLRHKVSSTGLKVDKAKIDVISKLPPSVNIKSIRSFLRHAVYYR